MSCGSNSQLLSAGTVADAGLWPPGGPVVLTLGDIDPDEPRKKVERLQPLTAESWAALEEFQRLIDLIAP